jgi:DNA-binding HxlR family transcriptional regulator
MAKQPGARVRGSRTGRPIMVLLDVLGQRWTLRILWELREERLNFRELRRRCEDVSPTLLNRRLKTLRELDLVDHTDEGYGYTRLGAELGVHISGLNRWSERWAKALAKS